MLANNFRFVARRFAGRIDSVRFLGSSSSKKEVPESFFDEKLESDKEFLDIAKSLKRDKSLRNLTSNGNNNIMSNEAVSAAIQSSLRSSTKATQSPGAREETIYDATFEEAGDGAVQDYFSEISDDNPQVPINKFNYSIPDFEPADEATTLFLDKFTPNTSPERFAPHTQGLRACTGKSQRHGMSKELRCHLIDLDAVNPIDVLNLKRFLTDDGEILPKRLTGLCSKCQRKVATTIKQSRSMGMLPHLGQYVVKEAVKSNETEDFHVAVTVTQGGKSKTVKKVVAKTVVV